MEINNPYGTAQICLNGHVIVDTIEEYRYDMKAYCDKCGQPTITSCPDCKSLIRGNEKSNDCGYIIFDEYEKPSFCISCGNPYPWTTRGIAAASELADLVDEFSTEDRELLIKNLADLASETPRTNVAAIQVKKILRNTEPHIRTAFKDTLSSIISEPIIKLIWGS
ncbi:DUF2321 domain-containing protein [Paenibacillus motobuensis]|uniref:DUF2321 domain-containing protein n=1 Tax=Paenibacillus motobuensis TaxID=295324 RepID=A0ABP3IAL3_9BACL